MEQNVQTLLQEEKEVNTKVQAALQQKKEKLGLIQQEVQILVNDYKQQLEQDMKEKIAQVSGRLRGISRA